jgi:hypothetical protein
LANSGGGAKQRRRGFRACLVLRCGRRRAAADYSAGFSFTSGRPGCVPHLGPAPETAAEFAQLVATALAGPEDECAGVHIDRTWANLWGPGRLKVEWHIFIDGILAGFGGEMGCSLGFHVVIAPAVALLSNERAIVVHRKLGRRGITVNDN